MKKLLFIALLALLSLTAFSQIAPNPLRVTFTPATQQLSGTDSVIVANTATGILYTSFIPGSPEYVEVVFNITKTSGTLGGSLRFEGSHDGVVWDLIGTAYTVTDGSQVKSFGVAKNANGKYFYRGRWTGTGTMNGWMEATWTAHY